MVKIMKKREQFKVNLLVSSANDITDVFSSTKTWFAISLFFEIDCIRNFYANMRSDLEEF